MSLSKSKHSAAFSFPGEHATRRCRPAVHESLRRLAGWNIRRANRLWQSRGALQHADPDADQARGAQTASQPLGGKTASASENHRANVDVPAPCSSAQTAPRHEFEDQVSKCRGLKDNMALYGSKSASVTSGDGIVDNAFMMRPGYSSAPVRLGLGKLHLTHALPERTNKGTPCASTWL